MWRGSRLPPQSPGWRDCLCVFFFFCLFCLYCCVSPHGTYTIHISYAYDTWWYSLFLPKVPLNTNKANRTRPVLLEFSHFWPRSLFKLTPILIGVKSNVYALVVNVQFCFATVSDACRSFSIHRVPRTNLMLMVVDARCSCQPDGAPPTPVSLHPVQVDHILSFDRPSFHPSACCQSWQSVLRYSLTQWLQLRFDFDSTLLQVRYARRTAYKGHEVHCSDVIAAVTLIYLFRPCAAAAAQWAHTGNVVRAV